MNPIHRIILAVVRLLAVGLFLIGTLIVMIYWAKTRVDRTHLRLGRCVYLSIPAVIGILMFAGSFPLAGWMRQNQDDDES